MDGFNGDDYKFRESLMVCRLCHQTSAKPRIVMLIQPVLLLYQQPVLITAVCLVSASRVISSDVY